MTVQGQCEYKKIHSPSIGRFEPPVVRHVGRTRRPTTRSLADFVPKTLFAIIAHSLGRRYTRRTGLVFSLQHARLLFFLRFLLFYFRTFYFYPIKEKFETLHVCVNEQCLGFFERF